MKVAIVMSACLAAVVAFPISAAAEGRLAKTARLAQLSAGLNGALLKEGASAIKNRNRAAFKEAVRTSVGLNKEFIKCGAKILIRNGDC